MIKIFEILLSMSPKNFTFDYKATQGFFFVGSESLKLQLPGLHF